MTETAPQAAWMFTDIGQFHTDPALGESKEFAESQVKYVPEARLEAAEARHRAEAEAEARGYAKGVREAATKATEVKARYDAALEKCVMADSIWRMSNRADTAEEVESAILALLGDGA